MDNSIYIMLSRQTLLMREMEMRANNLANATTSGYSAAEMVFRPHSVDAGQNRQIAFAENATAYRNITPGPMKQTGNALDVAINGQGYFSVETPLGPRYTRAGSFQIDSEGTLISAQGYPVLDASGQHIQFQDTDQEIVIGEGGNISVKGEERGTIGIFEFDNEQQLERAGATMFKGDGARESETATVQQGMLEGSNVSPVSELTNVIEVSRLASQTSKFISDMYDLQRKASTVLTKPS